MSFTKDEISQVMAERGIMTPIFNELDHRLSVVKRWGILHTIQTQSVAEHCHNVVRLASRIAVHWFRIEDPETILNIVMCAHHHDDFESLMGDPPTMIKPYIDEAAFESEHGDLIQNADWDPEVKKIVKLADMLEGFHFICVEVKLGNNYVIEHWQNYDKEIGDFLNKTWPNNTKLHAEVYKLMHLMRNERSTRHSRRGR